MAGGMDLGTGGKGGKKPLDAAINLVPFIDLMAVTISFLIMSAVWTQVGRLQVAQSGPSDPEQEQTEEKIDPITLRLTETELRLSVGQADWGTIPAPRDPATKRIDLAALGAKLKEAKNQVPKQNTIIVETSDAVRYEDLVRVIDECSGPDMFQNISVAGVAG